MDICAGSGSLTIKGWVKNPSARVVCVELSKTVLPFLLFNLSIRGIAGTVIHGDAITRQADAVYELVPDGRYSRIVAGGCADWQGKAGVVVMNPPFSVKWDRSGDARMDGFGIPPKSKGDFVFVLDGLFRLCDDGVLVAVLPHGVLFRGAQEQEIRKNLVDGNYIDAVIGLPPKLFMNTQIPVSIMVLKKNRSNRDILFIDASHEFKNCGRQNVMEAPVGAPPEAEGAPSSGGHHGLGSVGRFVHAAPDGAHGRAGVGTEAGPLGALDGPGTRGRPGGGLHVAGRRRADPDIELEITHDETHPFLGDCGNAEKTNWIRRSGFPTGGGSRGFITLGTLGPAQGLGRLGRLSVEAGDPKVDGRVIDRVHRGPSVATG